MALFLDFSPRGRGTGRDAFSEGFVSGKDHVENLVVMVNAAFVAPSSRFLKGLSLVYKAAFREIVFLGIFFAEVANPHGHLGLSLGLR